ncbi:MAG: hypothetical protein U0521_15300 [Anaerolineae bacterium]
MPQVEQSIEISARQPDAVFALIADQPERMPETVDAVRAAGA